MRGGVHETGLEHLVEVGMYQRVGKPWAVDVELRQRAEVSDLAPFEQVHGEDATGAVVLDRARYDDARMVGEDLAECHEVGGLARVVELFEQRLAEARE